MKKFNAAKIVYCLILAGMALLLVQSIRPLIKERQLDGYFVPVEKPIFSWNDWFEGKFQQQEEKFRDDRVGFKNSLVRMYNQKQFSLYKLLRVNNVLIGKEQYLYEINYINSYLGKDFVGDSLVQEQMRKLKFVQDTLQQKNIDFLVVVAPSKAYYYPNNFPAEFNNQQPAKKRNYEAYMKALNREKIPYIDFNDYFMQQRATTPHPLFTKGGIHWTTYGEIMAFDSIVSRLEAGKNYRFGRMKVDGWKTSNKAEFRDNDIEKSMNLLWEMKPEKPYAYPTGWKMDTTMRTFDGSISFIADSFYWGIYNFGVSSNVIKNGRFWYYNEQIFGNDIPMDKPLLTSEINYQEEIEKNKVIVLLITEGNFYKFGFGFIEKMYDIYHK